MAASVVRSGIDDRGVVTVTLDRPEVHNAYDEQMIAELREALQRWGGDPAVRLVVLRGAGRHFQAGADLACLRRLAAAPPEVNREFSLATTDAMHLLCTLPRPTLALVHGACYGGGVGMVACMRHRDRQPERQLRADRGALGRDPGADHPAALRRDGGAQPAPLRHHGRALRRPRGLAARAGPRGLRRRRARRRGGADHRGAAAERARGGRAGPNGSCSSGRASISRRARFARWRWRRRPSAPRPRLPRACRASSTSDRRPGTGRPRT